MTSPASYNPATKRSKHKIKHVNACLLEASQYTKTAGFETVELINRATAELSLSDISLSTKFLGFDLKAPLMIAPMTGGMELGSILNMRWARAAQRFGLAFSVGSQRLACEDDALATSFKVRRYAPDILLFANLGAAQLKKEQGLEYAKKAVEMIEANALFIHINPLQEACQETGDTDFFGIIEAISRAADFFKPRGIPVLVREVGFGLSASCAQKLIDAGVSGLDCAGAGGTSWAKVEAMCSTEQRYRRLGEVFGEWGIKTADAIANVRHISKSIPLIATGGIRSGLDIAKAIAIGADLAAMAHPMLKAAISGEDELYRFIEQILHELVIAMYASGARSIAEISCAEDR